jgi:hypothetical protein
MKRNLSVRTVRSVRGQNPHVDAEWVREVICDSFYSIVGRQHTARRGLSNILQPSFYTANVTRSFVVLTWMVVFSR